MKNVSKYMVFLADCAQWFDWEDLPYFTLTEGFETLQAKYDVDRAVMTKMVKKMARLGIIVNYSFLDASVFIAIDKQCARLFLKLSQGAS